MVYDLDVSNDGTKLYVAGSFTTIGGQTRQRIARLNLPSGTVDTAWTANANAIVATVSSDNNNVYVGGDFTTIKNTARTRVAKLNATNGNVVTAFNATADKRSHRERASRRTATASSSAARSRRGQRRARRPAIASLNPTTGALMPWAATGIAPASGPGRLRRRTSPTSSLSGNDRLRHRRGAAPGLLGGLLRRQHLRRLRCSLQHALPRRLGRPGHRQRLDVPGVAQPRLREEAGGYIGPNDSNDFIWYRLQAHRLSDGRLGHWTPEHERRQPGHQHDGRPAGHRDRRHPDLRRWRPEPGQRPEPAGSRPLQHQRAATRRPRCRRRRGSPRPRPAR